MSLYFKNIRYKNILSTGNAFTEISLNNNPSTLIIGENGSGKCLDPNTKVDINFDNKEVADAFLKFIFEKR